MTYLGSKDFLAEVASSTADVELLLIDH